MVKLRASSAEFKGVFKCIGYGGAASGFDLLCPFDRLPLVLFISRDKRFSKVSTVLEKRTTLKRSEGSSRPMHWTKAPFACVIFSPDMLPEESRTNTISRGTR